MAGEEHNLDALAEELASERISRGRALKRIGIALLGGLLASVPMGAALAAPCGPGHFKCGPRCCPNGKVCVRGHGPPRCVPKGQVGR